MIPPKNMLIYFSVLILLFLSLIHSFFIARDLPWVRKHQDQNRVKSLKECVGKILCFGVIINGTYFVEVYRGNFYDFSPFTWEEVRGWYKCYIQPTNFHSLQQIYFLLNNSVTCNFYHPLSGHFAILRNNSPPLWNWWFRQIAYIKSFCKPGQQVICLAMLVPNKLQTQECHDPKALMHFC